MRSSHCLRARATSASWSCRPSSDIEQGSRRVCAEFGGDGLLAREVLGRRASAPATGRCGPIRSHRFARSADCDLPLQYAPLVEARRLGPISYRTWMIATGEVKPRTGEVQLPQATVTEAISTADPEVLAAARKNIALVKTSLDSIRNVFLTNGESPAWTSLRRSSRRFAPSSIRSNGGRRSSARRCRRRRRRSGEAPTSLAERAKRSPRLPIITADRSLRARSSFWSGRPII